ncbi:hypothetical protein EDD85DRAFT_363889 [Armillaria nabsnona]|nr:hypothetical protein EDD85DRAFT_363889 [Armillaria nabsnona]
MDRLSTPPPSFFENSTVLILLGSSLSLSLVNGTGHDASTKVRAASNNVMPRSTVGNSVLLCSINSQLSRCVVLIEFDEHYILAWNLCIIIDMRTRSNLS